MPEFAISDYSVGAAKLSGCARDASTAAVNYGVVSGMSLRLFLLQDTEAKSTIIGKVIREAYIMKIITSEVRRDTCS